MSLRKNSHASGFVQGPYSREPMVCQFLHMTNSQGSIWFGGDPFAYSFPVLLLQFILIFVVTYAVWFILRPAKQGLISCQLIGGIILGRSFLAHIRPYREKLFPPGARVILESFADVGFMLHLFILGVHIDVSLLKRVGKSTVVIGITCFVLPFFVGCVVVYMIPRLIGLDDELARTLPIVSSLTSISSFPVITSLLTDLHILNSDIGRIATLTSLVSDLCNYVFTLIIGSAIIWTNNMQWATIFTILSGVIFVLIIVFGIRPIVMKIAKRVPEGQQMKEGQFITVVVIVLLCGLFAEICGQPAGLGTFILGVVIPDGPPLGSSLVNKLDTISTGLLVPAKLAISGLTMNLFSIGKLSGGIYALVIFLVYVAKFGGTLTAAVHFKILMKDAITLSLIMCCKGVIEAGLYISLMEDEIINNEAYALLLISMLIVTGIARPLIFHLYDPSARYLGRKKNSILSNGPNGELRFLVCIHNEDNARTIIDLLDASYPIRTRPIAVLVLNLMELTGKGASVLESSTNRKGKLHSVKSWSKHVANAFNMFEVRNQGSVAVRHFTSISPYASMHDDICTIALDQDANIVIIPFHKQWSVDGSVGSNSPSIRMVNQNVIGKCPCSVAVLVDRGHESGRNSVFRGYSMFHITVLFLGGADDREALAYSYRLIDNPEINLTFIWIRPWDHIAYDEERDSTDIMLVNQFRAKTIRNERIIYKEELVKDAIETTRVINSIEDCDLCIVGRYHDPDSPLLNGFTDWSEFPELGLIGDTLATSDTKFSVLVVQQQPKVDDFMGSNHMHPIASVASYSNNQSPSFRGNTSFKRV